MRTLARIIEYTMINPQIDLSLTGESLLKIGQLNNGDPIYIFSYKNEPEKERLGFIRSAHSNYSLPQGLEDISGLENIVTKH